MIASFGCTTNDVGEVLYRAMEHKKCYEESGSYGPCDHPSVRMSEK
ncbi:MAG: hypothetical protein H7832_02765 [Magnetococcus sp. DMHC-6]